MYIDQSFTQPSHMQAMCVGEKRYVATHQAQYDLGRRKWYLFPFLRHVWRKQLDTMNKRRRRYGDGDDEEMKKRWRKTYTLQFPQHLEWLSNVTCSYLDRISQVQLSKSMNIRKPLMFHARWDNPSVKKEFLQPRLIRLNPPSWILITLTDRLSDEEAY